ncbi:hypothetical protein COL32_08950 [Bacillus pseudomycoides]|nr:hypothetical protein CN584_27990 [Bacillus pseudomycoides]PFW91321.1 hypothetical protein COL29_18955 [Bacillus pseudomycoides]PFX46038.1 hypothetical protein COL32_08950 [Bacillus pseudomycoides]
MIQILFNYIFYFQTKKPPFLLVDIPTEKVVFKKSKANFVKNSEKDKPMNTLSLFIFTKSMLISER